MRKRLYGTLCLRLLIMLVPLISAVPAPGDELVLVNGDRLSGTLVRLEEGKLTIRTEYAEAISVPLDKVRKIATDEPAEVHLLDGEVLKGRVRTAEEGKLIVEPSPERTGAVVEMSRVAAINPPPKPPAKFKGNISLGGAWQSGNTDRRNLAAAAEGSIKRERDRFGARLMFHYAEDEEEVTTRNLFGALKYDWFFTENTYAYIGLEMLKDPFKDLDLRTVVGPGVGYQVWDDPVKSLLFEAGLTYFSEKRDAAEDKDWVSARLAGDFRYTFSEYLTFSDRLELYPSLENTDDFNLRNEAAILSPIGAGWSLKLANIVEYDNDPPVDVSETDLTTTLGLQYSF